MKFRHSPEHNHWEEPNDRTTPHDPTIGIAPFYPDVPSILPYEDDALTQTPEFFPESDMTILPVDPATRLQEDSSREPSRSPILMKLQGIWLDNSARGEHSITERDTVDEALDVTPHLGVFFELATFTIGPSIISAAVGSFLDHLDGRDDDAKTSWDIGEGGFSLVTGIRVLLDPTSAFELGDGLRAADAYAQLVQGLDNHLGHVPGQGRIDPDAWYTVDRWCLDQCSEHPDGANTCNVVPPFRGSKPQHPMYVVFEYGPRKKKRRPKDGVA